MCKQDSRLTEQQIVDKIVDNTEQPLKAIQSTQTGQFWYKHSVNRLLGISTG